MKQQQQEIARITAKTLRVNKHIAKNTGKLPPEQLALILAKQQRRENLLNYLLKCEDTRIPDRRRSLLLKERFARARAEGRPMVESYTVYRIAE